METRSALRRTAKTRGGGAAGPAEIVAEVAEAAAAIAFSIFSGARFVSIEMGCGMGAADSGGAATEASGTGGASDAASVALS